MNFIEAAKALNDGECTGIKRPGGVVRDGFAFDTIWLDSILATDWEMVNPKPRTEPREVKRWGIFYKKDNELVCTVGTEDAAVKACDARYSYIVELTGAYEVEIPRKVKRREEVTVRATKDNGLTFLFPHANDKTGTLTFEWEE
jgi:hypothetical protein